MTLCCPSCHRPLPDHDRLTLDPVAQTVDFRGQRVRLPQGLFEMFALLERRIGQIVAKGAMYDHLYALRPDADQPYEKVIDVQLCKLRRAIAPLGLTISTIYSAGMMLDVPGRDGDGGQHEDASAETARESGAPAQRAGDPARHA